MSDFLSKFPPPLQWKPNVTDVFVVILEKNDKTVILGTTNKGNPKSKNEMLAGGALLVLRETWHNPPEALVHYSVETADIALHSELDDLVRSGYTVRGRPVVIAMPGEPWVDGYPIQGWVDRVFRHAEDKVSRL